MELGTSLNVLYDPPTVSMEEELERLARVGFHVLDFNFTDWLFEGSPFVGERWAGWVQHIAHRANKLDMRFTQAHGPIFPKFEDSDKARWLTEMSYRSLEGAALVGARWVVFEPESLPGAFDAAHLAHVKQRNLDWFGALLQAAERAGVGIALENVADTFGSSRGTRRRYCSIPGELVDLVDAFNHPLVGICWDTGHAHIQRLDQGMALRAIGKRLKAVHIQDNHGEQDEHLLPFSGTIDWEPIMAALAMIGYEGDFVYEAQNSVRLLPDALRDAALRYALEVGRYLLGTQSLGRGG